MIGDNMGNCLPWFGKHNRRKICLLMVGLDNAGKTTAVKAVQRENVEEVAPTVGFSSVEIRTGNHDVAMIDLGGGSRIRGIWRNYMAEVHGVIYVVDSSAMERMDESKEVLQTLLSNPLIQRKPVLLLANKQDKREALSEYDICEKLNLEQIVNDNQCLCRVVLCAVITSRPRKNGTDKALKEGYLWLLHVIDQQYETLNERVTEDVRKRDIREKAEKAARDERVARAREERSRREAEEENNAPNSDNRPGSDGDASNAKTAENDAANSRIDVTADEHLTLPGYVPDESGKVSAMSARSGLGDQLLDDDDHDEPIADPAAARPASHEPITDTQPAEDSCTESQQRSQSRTSDIVRNTPAFRPSTPSGSPSAPNATVPANDEESIETESTVTDLSVTDNKKKRRRKRKSNKVAPLVNDQPPLSSVVLTPIKPNSLPDAIDRTLDHAPLPPLRSTQPNFDAEEDIPV